MATIDTSLMNTQWGKHCMLAPIVSFDNVEYKYSSKDGNVTIVDWGLPTQGHFLSTANPGQKKQLITYEDTEIPEAQVDLPIPCDMETVKFLKDCKKRGVIFKFTMYDPHEDVTYVMDQAYVDTFSNYALQGGATNTLSIKGTEIDII